MSGHIRSLRFWMPAAFTLGMMVLGVPARSAAQTTCDVTSCADDNVCYIDCPTDSEDYIVFGKVEFFVGYPWGWLPAGIGICQWENDWYAKGDCLGCLYVTTDPYRYRIEAGYFEDSDSYSDVVRLADASYESCTEDGGTQWRIIKSELPDSTDTYQFYGGGGADDLYCCDVANPTASDCISNACVLYGGYGLDYLMGSTNADYLHGGSDRDDIWGYAGNDRLYGESGNDRLYGGADNDYLSGSLGNDILWGDEVSSTGSGAADDLYGGDGTDSLYGEQGCDYLHGGEGSSDYCKCGYSNTFGEGTATSGPGTAYCETVLYCPGCLT